MGRSLKNIGTHHGAAKVGLGMAPSGVMGPGAAQAGTSMGMASRKSSSSGRKTLGSGKKTGGMNCKKAGVVYS